MKQLLTVGRIVRYYPKAGAHGYPAIVTRTFGTAEYPGTYCNLTVFVDGFNGSQDGFTEEEQMHGRRLAFSVPHEEFPVLSAASPRWGWPPRS